jgi:uncharacterized protein YydD (DUF2326 family)
MCIEFINFCLLKDYTNSRISKIPEKDFPKEVKIVLDLNINGRQLSIIRTRENHENVLIINNTEEKYFDSVNDASKYLQNILFETEDNKIAFPSFRQLLAPLMRDERSEFKDIISTFDTQKRIPPDFMPHLYLLGFDISAYKNYKKVHKDIENQTKHLKKLKEEIERDGLDIKGVKAKLNALQDEVKKLNSAIDNLRSDEAYNSIHQDLVNLEAELDNLRTRQRAIRYEIKKIETLPKPENISSTEISILYNQFKSGLGDLIEKSLAEMQVFKDKIDNFRNTLVNSRLENLNNELNHLALQIGIKDGIYSEKIKSIDNGKILKDLKTGISVYNKKSEELNKIRYQYTSYEEADKYKKNVLKPQLEEIQLEINKQITDNELIVKSFEQTILDIHEEVMGNKEASFDIKTKNSSSVKDYIEFEMRIDDDGSHSIERTKVFIYDVALLFNENTTQLEDGKTYDVILNSTNGMNQQIPTFTVHVDTLSEEYQIFGQDSIQLKNKSIYSLDKTAGAFYIKNGYMNIVPTFEYDLYKPVFFLLYYDGEKDIETSNNKLNLNLYFNNSIQSSNNSISSFISLEMPGEIYYKFQDKGMNDDDLIDVYLNSETVSGQEQIHCKMALKDFMLP